MLQALDHINRKKMVIIDSEVDLCLLMKAYYLRKNYEVHILHDVDEAIVRVVQIQPDFIMLDSSLCNNPEAYIKKLKQLLPDAVIHVR